MCYFEQVRYDCGSWKWGRFREQCYKEYRTGETCGLKLVHSTHDERRGCGACVNIAKKQRRITKMKTDIERWRREGSRPATLERTESDVAELQCSISDLWKQHMEGQFGGRQRRPKASRKGRKQGRGRHRRADKVHNRDDKGVVTERDHPQFAGWDNGNARRANPNLENLRERIPRRELWEECERYLVHAQHAAGWAELCECELEAAALLTGVSDYLYDRGRWREKEPVDETAYAFRKKVLGERHPDTIRSMADLAATYHAQGRYEDAEKITAEVLALRREVLGKKHPDTIRSMASLAATYHAQGRYDEDEKISVEVLALRRDVLGERHPDTLQAMHDLAVTWNSR